MEQNYDYHGDKTRVSRSSLCDFYFRSPRYYYWKHHGKGAKDESEKGARRYGSLMHLAVFEPSAFERVPVGKTPTTPNQLFFVDSLFKNPGEDPLILYMDAYKKVKGTEANKRTADAMVEEYKPWLDAMQMGLNMVVSTVEREELLRLSQHIRNYNSITREIFGATDGQSEEVCHWLDHKTRVRCKAKLDYTIRSIRVMMDLKTSGDASPDSFARDSDRYHYHWQPGFYTDGMYYSTDTQVDILPENFIFMVLDKNPPHEMGFYTLTPESIQMGQEQYAEALEKISICIDQQKWAGLDATGIQQVSLPRYSLNKHKFKTV